MCGNADIYFTLTDNTRARARVQHLTSPETSNYLDFICFFVKEEEGPFYD